MLKLFVFGVFDEFCDTIYVIVGFRCMGVFFFNDLCIGDMDVDVMFMVYLIEVFEFKVFVFVEVGRMMTVIVVVR